MGLQLGREESNGEGVWANVAWDEARGYVWWLDNEPALTEDGGHDARLLVARQDNPDARAFQRKQARNYRNLSRRTGGNLPDRVSMKILREQYAQTILLDWKGVEFPDGSTPPYAPERGVEAFEADEAFLDTVIDISSTTEAFRAQAIEEDAEALGNGSDGRSETSPS